MKPIIIINQQEIIRQKIDIDFSDAAILDLISNIHNWEEVKILNDDNKLYYWVSYDLILNQIPMLNMKKDTVYRKIKNMAAIGLIDIHPDSQKLGKSFMKITGKAKSLIFSKIETSVNIEQSDMSENNPTPVAYNPKGAQQNTGNATFYHENDPENLRNEIRDPSENNPYNKTNIIRKREKEEESNYQDAEENKIPSYRRDEWGNFSFLTVDFLKSLPGDSSRIDLDGQILELHSYSYLSGKKWEQIQKMVNTGEAARACVEYRTVLCEIMNEVYKRDNKNEEDEERRKNDEQNPPEYLYLPKT